MIHDEKAQKVIGYKVCFIEKVQFCKPNFIKKYDSY